MPQIKARKHTLPEPHRILNRLPGNAFDPKKLREASRDAQPEPAATYVVSVLDSAPRSERPDQANHSAGRHAAHFAIPLQRILTPAQETLPLEAPSQDVAEGLPRQRDQFYREVAARLPGRMSGLSVQRALDGSCVLTGVCRSYYVKQVVQHLAMQQFAEVRVVNQIRVTPLR